MIVIKLFGALIGVAGIFLAIVPTWWAIHRYRIDHNGLWFLTIITAPFFGIMFMLIGSMFVQL